MIAKPSRLLVLFIAAILLPATAIAQSDIVADDYETYEKIGPMVAEMSMQFLNENIVAIRTVAILKYCSKEGLAKVVEGKEVDRTFKEKLDELIRAERFIGLPVYSFLEARGGSKQFYSWV